MYTPDISSLQSEIAQLKKIISALLEQIEMLKANNTGAGQGIGQKDFIDLHTQQHIGQKDFTDLHTQQHIAQKDVTDLHTRQHMGQNESIDLHTQQHMGQNEPIDLHTQQRMGQNEPLLSHTEKDIEPNEAFLSTEPSGLPSNEPVLSLPPTLALSDENISSLAWQLEKHLLKRSRNSARENAAKLLIHFYNKGSGSYDELRKVATYESSGLGKLMTFMRRNGLIQRSAFQQFVPSTRALQLMQLAKLEEAQA